MSAAASTQGLLRHELRNHRSEFPYGVRVIADFDFSDSASAVDQEDLRQCFNIEFLGEGVPLFEGDVIWDPMHSYEFREHFPLPHSLGGVIVAWMQQRIIGYFFRVIVILTLVDLGLFAAPRRVN